LLDNHQAKFEERKLNLYYWWIKGMLLKIGIMKCTPRN